MDNKKPYPFPLKIAGIGKYLPGRTVTNREVEHECGLPDGWIEKTYGIMERRWIDGDTQSSMGALAAEEAIVDAGIDAWDIDFIINASLTFERKIPDGGPLIHRRLGLMESGIPATTIQVGEQSFLAALDVSMSLLATEGYRNILIVCSEIFSTVLDPNFPEAYALFADGAAAVVVTIAPGDELSCVEKLLMETYGAGAGNLYSLFGYAAAAARVDKSSDLAIRLDLEPFSKEGVSRSETLLDKLSNNFHGEPDLVIPQPVGMEFLNFIERRFPGKSYITGRSNGFCGAAAFPMALFEAAKEKKIKRDSRLLMAGFGSGLSVGGASLVY